MLGRFHPSTWLGFATILASVSCASSSVSPGAGDGAGTSGTGGTAAIGPGGSAGSSGSGGSGNQGGTSAGGNGGSAGTGATSGAGGIAGTGGTAGSAGTAGSGGAGGSTGGTGGNAGSGGTTNLCTTDADCVDNPGGPICQTGTGLCVPCLPSNDVCPAGQYCESSTLHCVSGCTDDTDCAGLTPHCRAVTHVCLECVVDGHCAPGEICSSGLCTTGCSAEQPCPDSADTCCGQACHNLQNDPTHCGTCDTECALYPNAQTLCNSGNCEMGACAPGFLDCDGDLSNGCEADSTQLPGGTCVCSPGAVRACYNGTLTAAQTSQGTPNVGACHAGSQVCSSTGVGWEPCGGQVFPELEGCDPNVDLDCDGIGGNAKDLDGDGWTKCNGDCCETTAECSVPAEVNPGAFELVGDGVDNDCDPSTSDTTPPTSCSTTEKLTTLSPVDLARAMDICQTTTVNPPIAQKKWGLISAEFLYANLSTPGATRLSDMQNKQTAVMTAFGTGGIVPQKGQTFAGLSSGMMRDANDVGYVPPNGGTVFTDSGINPPAAYLAAHAGSLPSSAGCSGTCAAGSGANDSVALRLTIRVPTNAKSLKYDLKFLSAEYWTFQCTQYNDFYLTQYSSGAAGLPADKNIAFDSLNNPISVNNGFFDVCVAKGCNMCPAGGGELAGTGLEVNNTGGATKWLINSAPVVPGETIVLTFMIFDVSDHSLDSDVLLDNFRWDVNPASVGTVEKLACDRLFFILAHGVFFFSLPSWRVVLRRPPRRAATEQVPPVAPAARPVAQALRATPPPPEALEAELLEVQEQVAPRAERPAPAAHPEPREQQAPAERRPSAQLDNRTVTATSRTDAKRHSPTLDTVARVMWFVRRPLTLNRRVQPQVVASSATTVSRIATATRPTVVNATPTRTRCIAAFATMLVPGLRAHPRSVRMGSAGLAVISVMRIVMAISSPMGVR